MAHISDWGGSETVKSGKIGSNQRRVSGIRASLARTDDPSGHGSRSSGNCPYKEC